MKTVITIIINEEEETHSWRVDRSESNEELIDKCSRMINGEEVHNDVLDLQQPIPYNLEDVVCTCVPKSLQEQLLPYLDINVEGRTMEVRYKRIFEKNQKRE